MLRAPRVRYEFAGETLGVYANAAKLLDNAEKKNTLISGERLTDRQLFNSHLKRLAERISADASGARRLNRAAGLSHVAAMARMLGYFDYHADSRDFDYLALAMQQNGGSEVTAGAATKAVCALFSAKLNNINALELIDAAEPQAGAEGEREEKTETEQPAGAPNVADFDRGKYAEVLMCRYRNGITFDSIDLDNFREIYEGLYDSGIDVDDAMLEKQLRLCGVFYNGRLFHAGCIMDDATKTKLFAHIENSFSAGKKVIYYKAVFEDMADDFASCYTLADENMLRAFIEFTAEDGKYYFFKHYMSTEAGVEIDNTAEVEEYLLSAGKPMKAEDVCSALAHIPADKVDSIIKTDSRFRRNGKGEYFHVDIFEISRRELEEIAFIIEGFIAENEYAIWTDVWNVIQEKMTVFLENNLYLSPLGVRNAISPCYSGRFTFNGAVISRPRDRYEMRDVYQLYAKHHSTFTADDIYNLSKELDSTINFDALFEVSVRVSHDLFISKDKIYFDVDAVDRAIGSFLSKDYIPVREIDSYLVFPNAGYEWNEYLLESFLLSYSKRFELLNNGLSLNNVAGFAVRENGQIKDFAGACADFLADGRIELKKAAALDYLASRNIISRRSYKDIDLVLRRAAQIRTRKG